MKKSIKIIAYITLALAIISLIFKQWYWPNQLIILGLAICLNNFILLPVYYFPFIKSSNSALKKGLRITAFIILFLLPLVTFMGLQTEMQIAFYLMIIVDVLFILYLLFIEKVSIIFDKKYGFFFKYFIILAALIFLILPVELQQPDKLFRPEIQEPIYPEGNGSLVYIDGGHNNVHQLNGRFWGFAKLLKNDGYQLAAHEGEFTKESLENCKILVIANALNEFNMENWSLPTPSAFSNNELKVISDWVWEGGSLLLIADHMPYGGANFKLGEILGFELQNGFALNDCGKYDLFTRSNQSVIENVLTDGRNANEKVDSIVSFTGHAFPLPYDAIPILVCDTCFYQYYPEHAWEFEGLNKEKITGFAQGAYKFHGNGRVVVFGEAAMITTQLGAGLSFIKVGMNSDYAPNNYKLVLNVIHWLDEVI